MLTGIDATLGSAGRTAQRAAVLFLCSVALHAHANGYFDYNAKAGIEVDTNQRFIPDWDRVATGYRFSAQPVLGYEDETRAWSIAPNVQIQRFGNDIRGDQNFFDLVAKGRYDWTPRFTTSLDGFYKLDSNLAANVTSEDPTLVLTQVPVERQSRNLVGSGSFQWTDRFSTSLTGSYFDILLEDVPGGNVQQSSLDSKSITLGANYFLTERLQLNGSVGLSQFKTFDNSRRNDDRFVSAGIRYALADKWTFAGSFGLRQSDQVFQTAEPGSIVPGDLLLFNGEERFFPNTPDGAISPLLDIQFGQPVVIVGGRPRQRLQEVILGFQTVQTTNNTFDLSLARSFERGSASLAVSRSVQPAGIGAQLDVLSLEGILTHRLAERLTGTLRYSDLRQSFQSSEQGDTAFLRQSLTTKLDYALSRRLTLSGTYAFRRNESAAFGIGQAEGHLVNLSISYNGDRLQW